MPPVIEVNDVTHRYGEVSAVQGVDLVVESGEIFGLIGPNGAGKTTLVRAITGTITPDVGTVGLLGSSPHDVDKSRVGLLPQAFSPPGRLSGREIIDYYGGLYPHARPTADVLADIGMEDAADRWFERLSGGQQRRVCVGTALVNDPDILILDEPTTGIDPRGRRRVWDLLRGISARGRTVLLTTHDMAEAETLADRVGLIADGAIVCVGRADQLIADHAGASRLAVEPTAPVGEETLTRLPQGATLRDSELVFPDVTPEEVPDVLQQLAASDVSYARFTWEEPTLEDVYFGLTEDDP